VASHRASGQPSTAGAPVDADSLSFIPVIRGIGLGKDRVTLLFALNPDYFINHIAQKLAAGEGSVSVLRYDGTLLMDSDPGGRPGSLRDHFIRDLRLDEVEFGQFEQDDGEDRPQLVAFRASRLYPFLVVTALDRRHALQQWRIETRTVLGVMVPALLASTLLAIGLYRRQMQLAEQRAESERLQQINAATADQRGQRVHQRPRGHHDHLP